MKAKIRIAVIANTSWYLYNFCSNLMRDLTAAGHDVIAVSPNDGYEEKIKASGIRHRAITLRPDSVHPIQEVASIVSLYRSMRIERVDLALSSTPKANIYTSLAAKALGIPVVPNVSGLGTAFASRSLMSHVVKALYRISFRFPPIVLFQNSDDIELFREAGLIRPDQVVLIPGVGVDLQHFSGSPLPSGPHAQPGQFTFLFVARLLWDKGLGLYVEAARQIRAKSPHVRFLVVGPLETSNPSAVPRETVVAWQSQGLIEYGGSTDDVRPYIQGADCIVLPSHYREGIPRCLMEAAAMRKPTITTDNVGCREAVEHGVTGFLCQPRSEKDLVDKMQAMLALSVAGRNKMGELARSRMEEKFDERIVLRKYREIIQRL